MQFKRTEVKSNYFFIHPMINTENPKHFFKNNRLKNK